MTDMAQIPRVQEIILCKEYEFIKIWRQKPAGGNVALCYKFFLLANHDKMRLS